VANLAAVAAVHPALVLRHPPVRDRLVGELLLDRRSTIDLELLEPFVPAAGREEGVVRFVDRDDERGRLLRVPAQEVARAFNAAVRVLCSTVKPAASISADVCTSRLKVRSSSGSESRWLRPSNQYSGSHPAGDFPSPK